MGRATPVLGRVLWRTRPLPSAPAAGDLARLTSQERVRAAGIAHPTARTRFVVARALLRDTIVEARPDLRRDPLELDASPSGRPFLVAHPEVSITVAHTRGLAVVAVAMDGTGVGIDVEPLDRCDLPAMSAWLTDAEQRTVTSTPSDDRHATRLRLWTAKEALLKLAPPGNSRRDIEVATCPTVTWETVDGRYLVALATATC